MSEDDVSHAQDNGTNFLFFFFKWEIIGALSRPIIFRIVNILLCFHILILGNISRISLSIHPLGRRQVATTERISVLDKGTIQACPWCFLFAHANGEFEICVSILLGERLHKELGIQRTVEQDLNSQAAYWVVQDEVTTATGPERKQSHTQISTLGPSYSFPSKSSGAA